MNLLCISSGVPISPAVAWPGVLEGVKAESVGPGEAVDSLKTSRVDAVLVRLPLEDWTPEDMLEQIQRIDAAMPVIFCDTQGRLAEAGRCPRLGALHYMV